MFGENHIMDFAMAVLPVILYSFMVYYWIPSTFVGNRRMRMYLFAGMFSPTIVYFFHFIFPFLNRQDSDVLSIIVYGVFIQVALVEEVSKFLTFSWVSSQRRNSEHDLPIATAYYAMMSSAGFALVENVQYLVIYGNDVLIVRCVTAIVLHMICGLVMGYFIAKSKMMFVSDKSELFSSENIRKYSRVAIGIVSATAVHGVYDLMLSLPDNCYSEITITIILGFGLSIGYFMIKELISDSIKIRRSNKSADIEET